METIQLTHLTCLNPANPSNQTQVSNGSSQPTASLIGPSQISAKDSFSQQQQLIHDIGATTPLDGMQSTMGVTLPSLGTQMASILFQTSNQVSYLPPVMINCISM